MNKFAAKPYLQRIWPDVGADVDRDAFPFTIPAVRELQQIDFHADVTFFVGENGSGKSTVLEAIALALGFGVEGGPMSIQLLDTLGERSALARHLRMSRSVRRAAAEVWLLPARREFLQCRDLHGQGNQVAWRRTAACTLAWRGLHERPAQ